MIIAVLEEFDRWILWHNGRASGLEQIGWATPKGADRDFPKSVTTGGES